MYKQYDYLWQITTCNDHLVLISQQKQQAIVPGAHTTKSMFCLFLFYFLDLILFDSVLCSIRQHNTS